MVEGRQQMSVWRKARLLVYLSLILVYSITYTNIQTISKIHQAIQYRITRDYHKQISMQT